MDAQVRLRSQLLVDGLMRTISKIDDTGCDISIALGDDFDAEKTAGFAVLVRRACELNIASPHHTPRLDYLIKCIESEFEDPRVDVNCSISTLRHTSLTPLLFLVFAQAPCELLHKYYSDKRVQHNVYSQQGNLAVDLLAWLVNHGHYRRKLVGYNPSPNLDTVEAYRLAYSLAEVSAIRQVGRNNFPVIPPVNSAYFFHALGFFEQRMACIASLNKNAILHALDKAAHDVARKRFKAFIGIEPADVCDVMQSVIVSKQYDQCEAGYDGIDCVSLTKSNYDLAEGEIRFACSKVGGFVWQRSVKELFARMSGSVYILQRASQLEEAERLGLTRMQSEFGLT